MTHENHSSGAIVTGDNSKEEILLKGSTAHIDLAQEIKHHNDNDATVLLVEGLEGFPCPFCTKGAADAAEKFYSALSINNRCKLVKRACVIYDGGSLVTIDPTLPQKPKVSGILNMLTGVLNDWWNYQDYETRQSISNLTDAGFGSLDEHDRAMNDNWKRLLVEEKLTLWRQFWNKNESDMAPELLTKISSHLHNLTQIDQHNELSLIFMDEQKHHKIDMHPWIDEWHACECDFAAWYAKLPAGMQARVVEYYKNFNE
ncbi:hypothetical protein [Alistipes timonensis]